MPLEVHPVADLFPMLAEDELKELADDIAQRGLLQPIVLDAAGRVLDGRNRLAACALANVEPSFVDYDGDDPDGYALAVNIARRHLRPSQRYLVVEKARRLTGLTKSLIANTRTEVSRLTEAAVVLDFAPDLADAVMSGAMSLDTAATTARERKREASEVKAKKERLSRAAPDLAEQVDDERLDLDEALGALEVREQRARQEAETARQEAERQRRAEEEQRSVDQRIGRLPADLAERVTAGSLGVAEAERVVAERATRLHAWVEKIRAGLETLTRMAGNPVPADLKTLLTEQENATLAAVIGVLENGEST